MQEDKTTINKTTIYIPPDVREQVRQLAKQHRRSFNSEVVWALQLYLESTKKEKK